MPHTAYIYDAVRTPRSKGKAGGSLYQIKPVDLGATLLRELQSRHQLDTSYVDDVVMGCVTPVGEQGGDVAKMIVQNADWDESVAGVLLDRFCASGLEAVNIAAQKIASGWKIWWWPAVLSVCRVCPWALPEVQWVQTLRSP